LEKFKDADKALKGLLGNSYLKYTDQLDQIFVGYQDEVCRKAVFEDNYQTENATVCAKHFNTFNSLNFSDRDVPHYYEPRTEIEKLFKNQSDVDDFYKSLNLKALLRTKEISNKENESKDLQRLKYHLKLDKKPNFMI
jgi:hypothetical protein